MQYTDSIKAFFTFRSSYGVSYPHERNFVKTYQRSMVSPERNCTKMGNSKQHYVLIPYAEFCPHQTGKCGQCGKEFT